MWSVKYCFHLKSFYQISFPWYKIYPSLLEFTSLKAKTLLRSHLKFLSARGKLLKHSTSDDEILDVLIASCHSLELLALVNVNLGSSMILSICIQNGKTLKSLQLTHCKDATFAGNVDFVKEWTANSLYSHCYFRIF